MPNKFIIMNSNDNCATSFAEIPVNDTIQISNNLTIVINDKIPFGHKFALKNIKKGELVYKYGEIIGIATKDVNIGDWIHTHNITSHYLEERSK